MIPLAEEMGSIQSAIKGAEELIAHLTSPEDQDVAKKASQRLHLLKTELQALEVASGILSRRQEEFGGVNVAPKTRRDDNGRDMQVPSNQASSWPPSTSRRASEGLESDACVYETRTMQAIILGGVAEGFFAGGFGEMAQGEWRSYGCWRKHACLDSLNAVGFNTSGDAICYKFNFAQHSWL